MSACRPGNRSCMDRTFNQAAAYASFLPVTLQTMSLYHCSDLLDRHQSSAHAICTTPYGFQVVIATKTGRCAPFSTP